MLGLLDSDTIEVPDSEAGLRGDSPTYTKIRTSNSSVFVGTNAADSLLLDPLKPPSAEALKAMMVEQGFPSYVLDRMDRIHLFMPPKDRDEFKDVLRLRLDVAIAEQKERHAIPLKPEK